MIAEQYLPILIMILLGILFAASFTLLSLMLGPKLVSKVKQSPFESGHVRSGLGNQRHEVKFYMTALVFLIFDVEVVFLYPWAVVLKELSWYGLIVGLFFIFMLTLGLVYEWSKGALKWE